MIKMSMHDEVKKDMAELTDLIVKNTEQVNESINSVSLEMNNRIDTLSKQQDELRAGLIDLIEAIKKQKSSVNPFHSVIPELKE